MARPALVSGADGGSAVWIPASISGDPDHDINGLFDAGSLVDHGGGEYTQSWDNSFTSPGINNGWSQLIDIPSGWLGDGTQYLQLRVTPITVSPSVVNVWTGIALVDNNGDPAAGGACGPAVHWGGTNWAAFYITPTNILAVTAGSNAVEVIQTVMFSDNIAVNAGRASFCTRAANGYQGSSSAMLQATGGYKIAVCGGYRVAGADGPVAIRAKYEYRLLDL
jgi:hypothetical protein